MDWDWDWGSEWDNASMSELRGQNGEFEKWKKKITRLFPLVSLHFNFFFFFLNFFSDPRSSRLKPTSTSSGLRTGTLTIVVQVAIQPTRATNRTLRKLRYQDIKTQECCH